MANFLTLRTQPGASILKLDAAFFAGSVRPLLEKRGFAKDAEFVVDVDAAGLERLFTGKQVVPATGTLTASAKTWRALLLAASAREQESKAGARDIGGQTALAGQTKDWVRRPGGRRVKARPNTRSLKIAAAPTTQTAPTSTVTDPAAFALQNLARLAALVVDAVKGANDEAGVVVEGGVVVVDGVRGKALSG